MTSLLPDDAFPQPCPFCRAKWTRTSGRARRFPFEHPVTGCPLDGFRLDKAKHDAWNAGASRLSQPPVVMAGTPPGLREAAGILEQRAQTADERVAEENRRGYQTGAKLALGEAEGLRQAATILRERAAALMAEPPAPMPERIKS